MNWQSNRNDLVAVCFLIRENLSRGSSGSGLTTFPGGLIAPREDKPRSLVDSLDEEPPVNTTYVTVTELFSRLKPEGPPYIGFALVSR